METGVSHNKRQLRRVGYFRDLMASNENIDDSIRPLLQLSRDSITRLQKTESALVRSNAADIWKLKSGSCNGSQPLAGQALGDARRVGEEGRGGEGGDASGMDSQEVYGLSGVKPSN
jgi:hypothetical protein